MFVAEAALIHRFRVSEQRKIISVRTFLSCHVFCHWAIVEQKLQRVYQSKSSGLIAPFVVVVGLGLRWEPKYDRVEFGLSGDFSAGAVLIAL